MTNARRDNVTPSGRLRMRAVGEYIDDGNDRNCEDGGYPDERRAHPPFRPDQPIGFDP